MKGSASFVMMKGIQKKKKKKIVKLCCEVTMKNVLESIDTYLSHFSKRMKWTKDHDIIFLRELITLNWTMELQVW